MVFSTTTLFKKIPCPEGKACVLTNCIYAHDPAPEKPPSALTQAISTPETKQSNESDSEAREPPSKRRKVTYESLAEKPPSRADLIRNEIAATRTKTDNNSNKAPTSLVKPVSPPPAKSGKATSSSATSTAETNGNAGTTKVPEKPESLNPRLTANDPAGHSVRTLYLKHLHGQMDRLNKLFNEQDGLESKQQLYLSEQKLIKLALGEEEKIAREQTKLYGNVVKQRIAALKKMEIEDWIKYVRSTLSQDEPKPEAKGKSIETDLTSEQEALILPQLIADQTSLARHGYVPTPPSAEEASEAAAAVEASHHWEVCDRCSGRFQVFPERNEQGLLTSGGSCVFHPNRKVFPPRSKTDRETGEKQPYYPCCNELVGTTGCTKNNEHVFKTSSPARLAATFPFVTTPENPSPAKDRRGQEVKAVVFDCEMGYTAHGMELMRLTAVTWPMGEELLDILVRPLGAVIDFNSRFSGVFPEHFQNAIPYDEWKTSPPQPSPAEGETSRLPMVDSPARARELLCSFITPETPLIGHAIDNDLNTIRLCHPTIIDTIMLYPHPKGLPMRFGLRNLTLWNLDRAIQTGGERGHDSKEDAVATGDLVRLKVAANWKLLRASGWRMGENELVPPASLTEGIVDARNKTKKMEQEAREAMNNRALFGSTSKKRKSRDSEVNGEQADEKQAGEGEGVNGGEQQRTNGDAAAST